jgi:hypothetical protein
MVTEPVDGSSINNPKPKIKANLATMGDVDSNSVEMRVSGVGQLPTHYDPQNKILSAQVAQNLRPGNYTVIIEAKVNGQKVKTSWSFKFDPNAKPTSPADAPLPPRAK